MIEGIHYKLRTPNSYYPLKKNGKFNRIAEANAIHSVLIGYKKVDYWNDGGWMEKKSNKHKWEILQQIAPLNEKCIYENLLMCGGKEPLQTTMLVSTTSRGLSRNLSANRYSTEGTAKMSAHVDGKDLGFGMTTMYVFQVVIMMVHIFVFRDTELQLMLTMVML